MICGWCISFGNLAKTVINTSIQEWGLTPAIPEFGWRQEDCHKFQATMVSRE